MVQGYMSQRNQKRMSGENDDTCGEAVMAAMQAVSDHCGSEGIPMEMGSGMVQMVPREAADRMKNMQPGDMTDDELMEMVEESPWLSNWTESLCRNAGLTGGTEEYNECVKRFARDALDGS